MNNKTGKYLKYAFGEILLVVIGILIALQINNWNEDRKQKIKQKALLTKFSQDLVEDYNNYETYTIEFSQIDSLHQSLFDFILKGDALTARVPELIRRSAFFNPVSKDNNPNITTDVDSDDIRKSIQIYFRDINETFNSVIEYRAVIVEIRDYLRKKGVHNFEDWAHDRQFTNIISVEDLSKIAKERSFQQLLFEASLKLDEVNGELQGLILSNKKTLNNIIEYLEIL